MANGRFGSSGFALQNNRGFGEPQRSSGKARFNQNKQAKEQSLIAISLNVRPAPTNTRDKTTDNEVNNSVRHNGND